MPATTESSERMPGDVCTIGDAMPCGNGDKLVCTADLSGPDGLGVCRYRLMNEGEACHSSLPPMYATYCAAGLACVTPPSSGAGAPGVCSVPTDTTPSMPATTESSERMPGDVCTIGDAMPC